MKLTARQSIILSIIISFLFFAAYATLAIIRQQHFWSGYDVAVVDQAIWKYSHFAAPISTNHAYAFTPILWDHVELIYPLLIPFYWVFNDIRTLMLLQSFAICASGVAVFLLARSKKLSMVLSFAVLISYLMFYGIQNAIWSDVHSLVFGVSFLPWFIYFLETKHIRLSWLFFILSIISKEDIALLTLLISAIFYLKNRDKQSLFFIGVSLIYLFGIFYIYFPHFVPGGYRFQSKEGLVSNININNFYNTNDKRDVLFFSSLWFGFLPLLSPLYLIPAVADLAKYFVLANSYVSSGQNLFMHYRSSLAILLVYPTIYTLSRFKKLNNKYMGLYILMCTLFLQFYLHLPLSYLSKKWFWTTPQSVHTINIALRHIPPTAAVATQVNILPHLSHRTLEFTLWPEKKNFLKNSPCGQMSCNWLRWAGKPEYMIVDTSTDWDARYWLTNRDNFIDSIKNLEITHTITPYMTFGSTTIYKIISN